MCAARTAHTVEDINNLPSRSEPSISEGGLKGPSREDLHHLLHCRFGRPDGQIPILPFFSLGVPQEVKEEGICLNKKKPQKNTDPTRLGQSWIFTGLSSSRSARQVAKVAGTFFSTQMAKPVALLPEEPLVSAPVDAAVTSRACLFLRSGI